MDHTFTLTDADGVERTYETTQHPGDSGSQLADQVLVLLVEPLLAGLGPLARTAILKAQKAPGKDAAAKMRASMVETAQTIEAVEAIDIDALSRGVKSAVRGLGLPVKLRILRFTTRDGKPLVGREGHAAVAYLEGYSRNYAELYQALWEVVRFNRFFPGLDIVSGVLSKVSGLMGGLLENDDSNDKPES